MKKIFLLLFALHVSHFVFSQDTTKTEFKPSGKFWGHVFGDYAYKVHGDSSGRGNTEYSNMKTGYSLFNIRRIYLGYDYSISEKFSSELLISHEGGALPDGNRSVYIKLANLRWKNILPMTDLVVGESPTPTFAMMSDKVWSYRSVEKTIADMRKIATPVDVGVALQGKLNGKGDYGYNLMIANGSGAKFETNKFRKFYGDVYAKFMDQKIIVDVYADYESSQYSPNHKYNTTFKGFFAYQTENLIMGMEAFQQTQKKNVVITNPSAKKDTVDVAVLGVGIFVRGEIIKDKLNFFARYDLLNPDTKFDSNNAYSSSYAAYNEEIFAVLGLDYMPAKNIHFMPNIWYNAYQDKRSSKAGRAKNDYDLTARVTLYYVFK